MNEDKKNFIQEYINQLKREIYSYNKGSSDESSLFDIITEISGVFSKELPDLQKDLSFNNGTAMRDARIVLGLLNKELIEDSGDIIVQDKQNEVLDVINQLKLEIGSFKSTALDWSQEGNIGNYLDQLDSSLKDYDIKSIKYCLKQIQEWYRVNLPEIINALYYTNKPDHETNSKKIDQFVLKFETIPDNCIFQNEEGGIKKTSSPIIFISHSSSDKKYGDALRNFIIGLGVKDEQLIYTSHELNGIPMDKNIYEYLRENFDNKVFMIILWSNTYLESPACLNEMGAAWVTQSDYTNVYVPDFEFGNPKYHQCAVDTRKMGAVLKNEGHCRTKMIELKDKIIKMFNLEIDEKHFIVLLDNFMKEIV